MGCSHPAERLAIVKGTEMTTQQSDEARLTPSDQSVVELDESKINQRVIEVIDAMADAIEGVMRKLNVTYAEYELFRQMNMTLGGYNMAGIWDVWIVPMLNQIHHGDWKGTSENPDGPFYIPGAPVLDAPYSLFRHPDEPGEALIVSGQVRTPDGVGLAGAVLDLWQCNAFGFYSNFGMTEDMEEWDFRGRVPADDEGRFSFRTIKPPPYTSLLALEDPVVAEDFFAALGRSKYRPAHIHVAIDHPALANRYITQLYFGDDPYIDYDVGAAVKPDLVSSPVHHDQAEEIEASGLGRPFYSVDFDFVLPTGERVEV